MFCVFLASIASHFVYFLACSHKTVIWSTALIINVHSRETISKKIVWNFCFWMCNVLNQWQLSIIIDHFDFCQFHLICTKIVRKFDETNCWRFKCYTPVHYQGCEAHIRLSICVYGELVSRLLLASCPKLSGSTVNVGLFFTILSVASVLFSPHSRCGDLCTNSLKHSTKLRTAELNAYHKGVRLQLFVRCFSCGCCCCYCCQLLLFSCCFVCFPFV